MPLALDHLRDRVARTIGWLLWAHVPIAAIVAWMQGVPLWMPVGAIVVLTAVAEALAVRRSGAVDAQVLLAVVYAAEVAVFVGLLRGTIWQDDLHMYFFAALAILSALCSWPAILAFVGFVAVHHLALNFLMTELVFTGEADLRRVLLHAVILLTEGISLGVLTWLLDRMFTSTALSLKEAERAQATAEDVLARGTHKQAERDLAVSRLIAAITDMAAGDYGQELSAQHMPEEYVSVVHALNLLSRRLAKTVATVSQAVQGVQSSGGSLVSTAQALEGSAAEQAALLDRARRGFADLGEGIGATTELAAQADAAMRENRLEVEHGTELLSQVVAAMGLIEQSTGQIRQIVEVMDNIAFQTNLLALNAGVEAARAGETGRGFAVVASEVRALAQRAAESAREIRGLIDQGQGNVEMGTRRVDQTTQALQSLFASATRAAGFVSEISDRIRQQGQGLHGLQDEVSSLETQARHNAGLAARISQAGEDLNHRSQELVRGMAELAADAGRRISSAA